MNPYKDNDSSMKQLFAGYEFTVPEGKRPSRRKSLIKYFTYKLNAGRKGRKDKNGKLYKPFSEKFIDIRLGEARLTLRDLDYIKSCADDYERRGKPWGAAFWGMLKSDSP